MKLNTFWIIFLSILFTRMMDIFDLGFLFLTRALGIWWFDYDWYEAFSRKYQKADEWIQEKERIKKEKQMAAEQQAREICFIEGEDDGKHIDCE